jgi:hypothetical protein
MSYACVHGFDSHALPPLFKSQKKARADKLGPFLPVSESLLLYAGIYLVNGQSLQPAVGRSLLAL